jgi:hypothetical protein
VWTCKKKKKKEEEEEVESCLDMINKTTSFLAFKFEMKYMSPSTYVLRIIICRDIDYTVLYLDQEK